MINFFPSSFSLSIAFNTGIPQALSSPIPFQNYTSLYILSIQIRLLIGITDTFDVSLKIFHLFPLMKVLSFLTSIPSKIMKIKGIKLTCDHLKTTLECNQADDFIGIVALNIICLVFIFSAYKSFYRFMVWRRSTNYDDPIFPPIHQRPTITHIERKRK